MIRKLGRWLLERIRRLIGFEPDYIPESEEESYPEPWEAERPGAWIDVPGAESAPPHPRAETRPGKVECAILPGLEPREAPPVERGKVRATIYCPHCRAPRQIPWHGTNGGACYACGWAVVPISEERMGVFLEPWRPRPKWLAEYEAQFPPPPDRSLLHDALSRVTDDWNRKLRDIQALNEQQKADMGELHKRTDEEWRGKIIEWAEEPREDRDVIPDP